MSLEAMPKPGSLSGRYCAKQVRSLLAQATYVVFTHGSPPSERACPAVADDRRRTFSPRRLRGPCPQTQPLKGWLAGRRRSRSGNRLQLYFTFMFAGGANISVFSDTILAMRRSWDEAAWQIRPGAKRQPSIAHLSTRDLRRCTGPMGMNFSRSAVILSL